MEDVFWRAVGSTAGIKVKVKDNRGRTNTMKNHEQKTILLVEDDAVTMMVETHLLKSFGYDVVPAISGEEAVQIAIGNDKISLILMDVNLGDGIDGPEAAKQILLKRNLPVVFLSSHTDKEYVERIKGIAGYGYVVKNSGDVVLQSSIEMAFNLFMAQEAMREREALHRNLMAKLPVGIIIVDSLTRTVESVNAWAAAMFGVAAEQIVGHRCHSFLCPAEEKNCPVLDLGQKVDYTERVMLHADGSRHPILKSVTRIQLYGQEKLLECFVDITERKRAEKKSAMLSDAIETAHHGCLIISEDYKVVFANNYALTKLGFDSDELKNFDLFSLCADREQVKNVIETIKVTKRWMGECAIIKKGGEQFPALVSVTALSADGGASGRERNVILFQDITIQKEMREKLLTSEKLAVMGRLTADVAHELNNPLAIVIGGTQLVLSRIDEKPQEIKFKSQLETVLRNARRCKTILGNLLGYGRTIGKKEEAVNLPNLIREAIDDVNYQHDMSAIETVLNYGEITNAEITGNRSALLSVFVNLIRNARQAMGEKGRLTITIEKEDKKHLRIEIHDTGLGMGKEQKAKLFKPFTSGWKDVEGGGLGLATSLGIIETHGGSMSAESAGDGKGSTFTIILPCEFKGKK